MKFQIKSRWDQTKVLFEASLDASFKIKTYSEKLQASVKLAIKARAYLSGADLSGAYLSGADLSGANLSGAYLSGADLSGADLSRADLSRADLSGADLSRADLSNADLSNADLSNADLSNAKNVPYTAVLETQIVPEVGAFDAFKKAGDAIVRLRIPTSAKRSNSTGRKCRAERAKVISISDGRKQVTSARGGVYRVGEYTVCDNWEENRWIECGGGIHFFLTKGEAERW